MAFGFGPGNEMQKSFRKNRELAKKGKSLKEVSENFKTPNTDLNYPNISEQELEVFRKNLKERNAKKERKRLLIFSIFFALFLLSFYWIWFT